MRTEPKRKATKKPYKRSSLFLKIEAKSPVSEEYTHEGTTYYLGSDKHGEPKHLNKKLAELLERSGSRSLKEYKYAIATFNREARENYGKLLNLAISIFMLHKGNSCFIDLGRIVGWDKGIKTSVVELYYGAEIGSHIRPKAILNTKIKILTAESDKSDLLKTPKT